MKNSLMLLQDKIAFRKRALIETVNDELKNICQVEHTRHRSFDNFVTNLLSRPITYSFFDKKPSINLQENIVDLKDSLLLKSNSRYFIIKVILFLSQNFNNRVFTP